MRFIGLCCLVMAILPPGFALETASAQQGGTSSELWRIRSQTLTEELIKDSSSLPRSERALMWARLAQKWWREDPEKAHSWMLKPIEIVEAVPNRESPAERSERLTTVRAVLKIVASLDQKLSKRLVAILTQDAEHVSDADRLANADGLVEAAISIVKENPKRAAELGAAALRFGHPTYISSLLLQLRAKDAKLADTLFAQTMASARETWNIDFMNSLAYAGFPASMSPGGNMPGPPDGLQRELLKLYISYLQANPINPENRDSVCRGVISFIAPALGQFNRLLPAQTVQVQQSINQCQSENPLTRQRLDDATREQPLNTIEELLKAADDSKDLMVRTVYQSRAALLAAQQSNLDRALKILDSISPEARQLMGGTWAGWRWEWAANLAAQHFKDGDVYGMRQIINAVPVDLQSFAKIAFVSQLPDRSDKDSDPTLEFLNDARKGLGRLAVADADKFSWYFTLLKLAVKFQPAEAIEVLKELVTTLNRAQQAEEKKNGGATRFNGSEVPGNLPAALLELDEFAVKEAISSITSAGLRAQVRLELLGICLDQLRTSKLTTPKQGPSI